MDVTSLDSLIIQSIGVEPYCINSSHRLLKAYDLRRKKAERYISEGKIKACILNITAQEKEFFLNKIEFFALIRRERWKITKEIRNFLQENRDHVKKINREYKIKEDIKQKEIKQRLVYWTRSGFI